MFETKVFLHKLFQKRVIFVLLAFLGYTLCGIHRIFLGEAIVAMVNKHSENKNINASQCVINNDKNISIELSDDNKFDWSGRQQALLLGGYFYGYCILQLPAALLVQKFGAKWIYGPCILIASLLLLVGPVCAKYGGFALFFATRFLQGLVEGVIAPCVNAMIVKWLPKNERSFSSTTIFSGIRIGIIIAFPVVGIFSGSTFLGGWPACFYVFGIIGCFWFVLWTIFVFESPEQHPSISHYELDFIQNNRSTQTIASISFSQIPWKAMFSSIPFYALIIAHFGQNWGFLTLLTTLPTYFEHTFQFSIQKNGLISSIPYVLQSIIGWFAGFLSDKLSSNDRFSITFIRKFNNTIAFICPAVCMIAVTFAGCDSSLNIILFSLAMALNGPSYSGFQITHVDMAPDFAAILMGITSSIGNFPGFLAPIVANAFTKHNPSLTNWSYVFYTSSLIYISSALIFLIFGSARLQSWGIVDKKISDNIECNDRKREHNNERYI